MDDEPMYDGGLEDLDWDGLRKASISLAELVWTYHASLVGAGFTLENALQLTLGYQNAWIQRV